MTIPTEMKDRIMNMEDEDGDFRARLMAVAK